MKSLPQDVAGQIQHILNRLFDEGRTWIKGIPTDDWRRMHYVGERARRNAGTGPSVSNFVDQFPKLKAYIGATASSNTAGTHHYFIVKPDKKCRDDSGIAIMRPVLKLSTSRELQLNFHVWFHDRTNDDHLVIGWRLEGPEGAGTPHDYFHAQPLRTYGADESCHGLHRRYPTRFPTIPLPATNLVELCFSAVLVACGREALIDLARNSADPSVRNSVRAFCDRVLTGNMPVSA